jgi:hypothetical protein
VFQNFYTAITSTAELLTATATHHSSNASRPIATSTAHTKPTVSLTSHATRNSRPMPTHYPQMFPRPIAPPNTNLANLKSALATPSAEIPTKCTKCKHLTARDQTRKFTCGHSFCNKCLATLIRLHYPKKALCTTCSQVCTACPEVSRSCPRRAERMLPRGAPAQDIQVARGEKVSRRGGDVGTEDGWDEIDL